MDARQFIAEFGHIANAAGGVARLREMILQFAISGRLTEREPSDIPATKLIEQNAAIQDRLIQQRKLKRQPQMALVSQAPWKLPENWAWTRLGTVTNYGDAPKVELADVSEDTWVLELEDIEKGTSRLLAKVLTRERKFKSTKNGFSAGAVLYGKLRPYLDKVLIADTAGVCTTEISPISFFDGIESRYLRWYLKSPYFITYASGSTYGMNLPRMSTDSAREAHFPFPPKEEQSRIVAKVDELMALCDQLEAQQQARRHLQITLRRATLQALATTQTPHDLQTAWTRLANNFTRLFSAPEDVGVLRTLILELAVRGYLTEQSESEEPADQQVAKIRSLSTQSAESGRRRKAVLYRSVDENELDYRTPNGWTLARLGELVRVLNGRAYSKPELLKKGTPVLRVGNLFTSKDWYYSDLELEPDKYCDKGDLLYAWSASFGPFIWSGPKVIFHYHIWKLELFSEEDLSKMFLHLALQERTEAIKTSGHGISMAHMTKEKMEQLPIAVPPLAEQHRIVARVSELMRLCDDIEKQLRDANKLAERLAAASVAALTGIAIEQEEAPVKAPKTELFAPLHLGGKAPGRKDSAPLAQELARHQGGLNAKDLWQRWGMDKGIDAFYAQLKLEVANGWVREPEPAAMNEIHPDEPASA